MWRTRAPALYGFKTMCYGTLLPAPKIGAAAPHLAPQLAAAGHEVGLHGYDHVRWHDHLWHLPLEKVAREIDRAQETYTALMGKPAYSFAAPGWQCTFNSRTALAARNFLYASDTRGACPVLPRLRGDGDEGIWKFPPPCPPWMSSWVFTAAAPRILPAWSSPAWSRGCPRCSPSTPRWKAAPSSASSPAC